MKKKIYVIVLMATVGLFSCQSYQTKKNLCGTWVYTGGRYASVTFAEDGTFYTGGMLNSEGRYEIDGKEVKVYYSHGGSTTLRIADENNIYASDGTHFVKISDEEADKLESANDALEKLQRQNQALHYLHDYNAIYNSRLF